jgi:hypothetical protein
MQKATYGFGQQGVTFHLPGSPYVNNHKFVSKIVFIHMNKLTFPYTYLGLCVFLSVPGRSTLTRLKWKEKWLKTSALISWTLSIWTPLTCNHWRALCRRHADIVPLKNLVLASLFSNHLNLACCQHVLVWIRDKECKFLWR